MKYEMKFLDGPGAGRAIESDKVHKYVWLVNDGERRWTFKEPAVGVEAKYRLQGHAPRPDGSYMLAYGECPPPTVD
jgi:hypothetical protein